MAIETDPASFSYYMERRNNIDDEEEKYLRPLAAAKAVIAADARMKGCRIVFSRRKRKFTALVPMGAKQLVRIGTYKQPGRALTAIKRMCKIPTYNKRVYKTEGEKAFESIDKDHSGKLDWEEWQEICAGEDPDAARRLFELLDADRSGTVEMREFYGAMRKNREVIALAMRFSALRELVPKRARAATALLVNKGGDREDAPPQKAKPGRRRLKPLPVSPIKAARRRRRPQTSAERPAPLSAEETKDIDSAAIAAKILGEFNEIGPPPEKDGEPVHHDPDLARLASLARPAHVRGKFPTLYKEGGGFGSSADRFAFDLMSTRAAGRTPGPSAYIPVETQTRRRPGGAAKFSDSNSKNEPVPSRILHNTAVD